MKVKKLDGTELQGAKDQAHYIDCNCDPIMGQNYGVGICTECGCLVDEDGEPCVGCRYSPISCEECGYKRCNGSC